jgi:TnpA family transposase
MPVGFLTDSQRSSFGRFTGPPSRQDLSGYFHLDDGDKALVLQKRGDQSRLGFALQLTTVRFLGTFLDDPTDVPPSVIRTIARQLEIGSWRCLSLYQDNRLRWAHTAEIRARHGYRDFGDIQAGLRLTRWLYTLCWMGTDQPGVIFDRARDWLLTHKILLPGATVLEKFVSRLRARVASRFYRRLCLGVTAEQETRMEALLVVPEGRRGSLLDQLRSGPARVSGPALVRALERLEVIRGLGITLPVASNLPQTRIAALARFAQKAKLTAITRLPHERRLATLVAFFHCLEATAQDEAIEVLEIMLGEMFGKAEKAQRKARLRTIKDLDKAAGTLADACRILLDPDLPDEKLRTQVFATTPRPKLEKALAEVNTLIRPSDDVYYQELQERYRSIRRYLPAVLKHLHFGSSPAGEQVVAAFEWLRDIEEGKKKTAVPAPREVISKPWERHVLTEGGHIDPHAYTFCVLDSLHTALKHRDVFVRQSWRYADPRAGLLDGPEWEATRPVICRTLGLSPEPGPVLKALAEELDQTYRAVAARLPENPAVRFETVGEHKDLILTPLDKLDEPASLVALREAVAARLPIVDLPEILLEIAARTRFTEGFTHVAETSARADELPTSLCAVLLAEACNTGIEVLVRPDVPALRRDRLFWTSQNYLRDETLTDANARLVEAQNQIPLAHAWGGGEVASADGMRFVVPVRTVHAGPNPKYFGNGRGVTWYNLISDQFTGLNAITVPGTLRDSLVLLAVVLEQQTELHPSQIMTDTGAYSDVVFGLFRLVGYRFSPRMADIGGTRFWRIDPQADYGELNALAHNRLHPELIAQNWDDILRLAGSLKLGRVPAAGIMRTLQVGDRPTQLAQAVAEFGRIEKTLHALTYLDDETKRRAILLQLNRGEGRHSLAREVFHGKRGELRQRYREGQEDQLGSLGLVLNVIVLWNTIYMDAILTQLRTEGYSVRDEDVARLSPFIFKHINLLGRYSFLVSEAVARGELRPLRREADDREEAILA